MKQLIRNILLLLFSILIISLIAGIFLPCKAETKYTSDEIEHIMKLQHTVILSLMHEACIDSSYIADTPKPTIFCLEDMNVQTKIIKATVKAIENATGDCATLDTEEAIELQEIGLDYLDYKDSSNWYSLIVEYHNRIW